MTGNQIHSDALSVARELVRFCMKQPSWTRRTKTISDDAQALRQLILNASDPNKTIFDDLPVVLNSKNDECVGKEISATLEEIQQAYPKMLNGLQKEMLDALGHKPSNDLEMLKDRARGVSDKVAGHFQLAAFVNRLKDFNGTAKDMESLVGMTVNRPPHDWSDKEPKQAELALADYSLKFRHAEMLTRVHGRPPNRHAIGIVLGTGEDGQTMTKSFDVGSNDSEAVQKLTDKLVHQLTAKSIDPDLALAALVRAGTVLIDQNDGAKITNKT